MSHARSVLVLGTFVLISSAVLSAGGDASRTPHKHHGSHCAEACAACANACSACVEHCLGEVASGRKAHAQTLKLCNDCGDLCSLAARVESRNGTLRRVICEACLKGCEQCAAECSQYKDQPHMVECAKACLVCAAACRESLGHAAGAK